ncbi:hypothetical protein [uncultured Maribacter sp.]|uniref:hypothetical protein n=1 Tax=uncultured Maribacter sp. TaxID=431308 RepID=UPI00260F7529|nr:hypothetical protein [uncultured Maribacter sp.]
MGKKIFTLKNIALGIGFVLVDLAIYVVLGLLLMDYDDFYDESEGAYWSLESMTTSQKTTYIGLNIWHVINVIIIGYVIYRIVRSWKNNVLQQNL